MSVVNVESHGEFSHANYSKKMTKSGDRYGKRFISILFL